jgi:hypothetical protein
MNKRIILSVVLSTLGIALIAFLLSLGDKVSVPTLPPPGGARSAPTDAFPKGASDSKYTILCIKYGDAKLRFSKTGPYVTCPPDYATVPIKLNPKLIKK